MVIRQENYLQYTSDLNDLQSIPFSAASEVDTDSLVHKNEVLSLKTTSRTTDDRQYWQEVFL